MQDLVTWFDDFGSVPDGDRIAIHVLTPLSAALGLTVLAIVAVGICLQVFARLGDTGSLVR